MNQKLFKRAEALGEWLGWEIEVIDFDSKGVMYRKDGPYRRPTTIKVNRVFFESLETAMRGPRSVMLMGVED